MIKYLSDAKPGNLRGTALLRLDFNTEDDWRLRAALPTVRFLLRHAAKIVIVGHRGRPQGADKKFSLKRDAIRLEKLLKKRVRFVPYLDFAKIKKEIDSAPRGSILVLENIRFWKGEEADDQRFVKRLASLADFYVNDAFAVSHRANASVSAITKFLPSYAGLEMEREIASLSRVMKNPKHPLVLVLGGGKASDKLGVIEYFKNRADRFLLGGAPANTLLFLKGMDVKKSLRDQDKANLKKLRKVVGYKKIILPDDFEWNKGAILDVGPLAAKKYAAIISSARTIIWSGPLGLIEKKRWSRGSLVVARAVVRNRGAFSLTGGGETVTFLKKYGLDKKFNFVSTGGGAMLDFLAGKKLPGIEALQR